MTGLFVRVAMLLLSCWLVACPEEPHLVLDAGHVDIDGGDDDGGALDMDAGQPSCVAADDGVTCGVGRHCIDEACVFNTCGDGVVAGLEACDDGNQGLGDGCTPSCRVVPGFEPHDAMTAADAGDAGDARTPRWVDGCPVLEALTVTPFVGEPAYLVGRYFNVEARFDVTPTFIEWQLQLASVVQPPRADLVPDRQDPSRADVNCSNAPRQPGVPDPGDVVVRVIAAYPGCALAVHEVPLLCPERPLVGEMP